MNLSTFYLSMIVYCIKWHLWCVKVFTCALTTCPSKLADGLQKSWFVTLKWKTIWVWRCRHNYKFSNLNKECIAAYFIYTLIPSYNILVLLFLLLLMFSDMQSTLIVAGSAFNVSHDIYDTFECAINMTHLIHCISKAQLLCFCTHPSNKTRPLFEETTD